MKKPGFAPAILFTASAALAHTGVKDKTVLAWMEGMTAISGEVKTLTRMARGQIDYDATTAEASIKAMQAEAQRIPALFEDKALDPKSESSPAIWTDWDRFAGYADDLDTALGAADTSSPAAIRAALGDIGTPCRACHEAFRIEQ